MVKAGDTPEEENALKAEIGSDDELPSSSGIDTLPDQQHDSCSAGLQYSTLEHR